MVRANLRVLIDFKYISFLATNSKKPSFFEAQIPWSYFKQEIFFLFSVLYSFLVHSGTKQFCGIFKNSRHVHQAAIFTTQQGPTSLNFSFFATNPFWESAQVVETSVTNNSPSQDSNHPDDLFQSIPFCYA